MNSRLARGGLTRSKLSTRLAAAGVFLALSLLPPIARAAGRVQCSAVRSAILHRSVRYCALLPPSYDNDKRRRYPVLYYLHGLYEDEQSFVSFGGWNLVEDLQEEKRIGEFLIVTLDGGRSFYLNSHDGKQRYEDFFIREFIPAIERAFRIRATRAQRSIGGTSMGGYGALHLAFKYPERFGAVSAHSAALVDKPPGELFTKGAPPARWLAALSDAFGTPPNREFWIQQSPLTLARQKQGLNRLKIYFDCGTEDEYGFDAGARALNELLNSRRVAHEFHLYPGGHGWLYVAEHLPASLEFHSRAFRLAPDPPSKTRPARK
jgi:S-formylglutathione hydrolase FrmB